MTGAEREVLERRRASPYALYRASAALLLDRDHAAARALLAEAAAEQRRYLASSLQPGHAGYSPCGIAEIAACHILSSAPAERHFDDLLVAFEPVVTAVRWKGCGPRAVPLAHGLIAWLAGDASRAARHLRRLWPEGVLDELLAKTLALLVRGGGSGVGAVLTEMAPRYQSAMARKLWQRDPDAFLHVRLLSSLLVGAERGQVDLTELPDVIPYAPIDFLVYSMS